MDLSHRAAAALGSIDGLAILATPGGDPTKLVIDVSRIGHSGFSAAQWLRDNERVHVELADFKRIICSLTVGDSEETCDILINAVSNLAKSAINTTVGSHGQTAVALPPIPPSPLTPRAALNSVTESVAVADATGRTCAEYVIPYPPGIPLVVPGETLTAQVLEALWGFQQAGSKIVGPNDPTVATILVTPR